MQPFSFDFSQPVAIGADHAGVACKEQLVSFLEGKGLKVKDLGTYGSNAVDYPDYAHPVAKLVDRGQASLGILICGTGNGVAMTANKYQGVRAAVCWGEELSRLARAHNNANVLCIPGRFVAPEQAVAITDIFLETSFAGGRHEERVRKVLHL
ncbi:ribose 5-phosphate isomerase B [Chitinophaga costaii]|uniref:Ribose 5-phosphate isomerase B n=1 Tax=Chitinophaga costaii TaxID=1335309 RepID=A0A1C4FPL4_9BACT|nr:ribose 5-phosphate isomerase B [Chitinophaga costaii]PUZ20523.1 ribose 5-phosphate isomerase B [Chitinophaga costaii]SCC57947.1 ribose 5-phosphate isomerase B [Chitinophaga costaii]